MSLAAEDYLGRDRPLLRTFMNLILRSDIGPRSMLEGHRLPHDISTVYAHWVTQNWYATEV
jgi:hypothetical protein